MKSYPAIVLFLLVATAQAQAELILWDGSNDQFWGKGNNWQGPVPTELDDVLFDDTAFGFTVNLGSGSRAANSLTIDSATAYTIENQIGTPELTLTLGNVTVSSGTGHVIFAPVVLAGDATYHIAAGADLTLEDSMSGNHSLTKTGDGQLVLGRFSYATGDTIINEGSILLDNQSALQFRSVTLNVDGGLVTNGLHASLGSLAGSGDFYTNDASVAIGFDDTDTTYSGTLTSILGGSITGEEFIEKLGDGTWTLTGTDYNIETGFSLADGQVIFDGVNGFIDGFSSSEGTGLTFSSGTSLNIGEAFIDGFTATDASTVVNFESLLSSGELIVENDAHLNVTSFFRLNSGSLIVDGGTVNLSGTLVQATPGTVQLSDPSGGGPALTFDRATNGTFNGVISDHTSGPGSIEKTGIGLLTLTGENTHSGTTTISAGQIVLGNALALQNSTVEIGLDDGLDLNGHDATLGGLSGSGDLALGINTLTVGGNDSSTSYDGVLSGTGSILKTGTGTLTLRGDNTYTGGTTINSGSLQLGNGGTTGSILGDVDNAGTLIFNRSSDLIFNGAISGSGALSKLGAGALTLTSANTHSGPTTISAGQIVLGNALALQNSTVEIGLDDGLDLNGHNATLGGLSGSGDLALGINTLTVGGNDSSTSYTGVLSGTGGLIKEGSGTLSLGGDNPFTGDTIINEGAIFLTPDADNFNSSLRNSTVTVNLNNGLQNYAELNLLFIGALAGSGNYDAGNAFVEVGENNASTSFSGNISVVSGVLQKEGTGTWTLDGGNLNIDEMYVHGGAMIFDGVGGSLGRFDGRDRPITFQNGADLTVGILSGASITIDRSALTVNTLDPFGDDTIAISDPDGGTALTFNSVSNSEVASTITDHTSGPGSIEKQGTGTLILSRANTHSGTTTISAGQIVLGNALALQNSTVEIGLDDGLDLNGNNATLGGLSGSGDLALGANALTVGGNDSSTSYDGVLSGTGGLIKDGTGTLSLSGDNPFNGDTIINEGAIFLSPDADNFNFSLRNSTVTLNVDNGLQNFAELNHIIIGALAGSGNYNAGTSFIEVGGNNASTTFSGNLTHGSSVIEKEGTGTWTLEGGNLSIGTIEVYGGAMIFDGVSGSMSDIDGRNRPITFQNGADLQMAYLSGDSITIDRSALTVTAGIDASIGGPSLLAISDPDGGTALTVNADFSINTDATITDHTSGPGSIEKQGTGTLILSGANTYTGNTTINNGILRAGNSSALAQSSVFINIDGGLETNGSYNIFGAIGGSGNLNTGGTETYVGGNGASTTYSGNLDVDFYLQKEGSGTWTLSGTGHDVNEMVITGGEVRFDGAGGVIEDLSVGLTSQATFQNGASVNVGTLGGGSATVTGGTTDIIINRISSIDTLTVEQGAQVEVSNNLFLGGGEIIVNEASLLISGGISALNGDRIHLSDPDGGTALTFDLSSNQEFRGIIADHSSGPGSIEKLGTGTLTLRGANTYSGETTISGGQVVLGNALALQNSTVVLNTANALDLNGYNATLGGLSGSGDLVLSENFTVGGNNASTTYSGGLSGNGALAKTGAGTLTLSGTNTYTGLTAINAGALIVDGSTSSNIAINSGGTLGGAGAVGDLLLAGTLSPGNSPGTLSAGNTTWLGGGEFIFEINDATGIAGTNWDLLDITGVLDLSSLSAANSFTITLLSLDTGNAFGNAENFDPAQSYSWDFVSSDSIFGFNSDHFAIDTTGFQNAPGSDRFSITRSGDQLSIAYTAIPEPSTFTLMLGGLLALMTALRSRARYPVVIVLGAGVRSDGGRVSKHVCGPSDA